MTQAGETLPCATPRTCSASSRLASRMAQPMASSSLTGPSRAIRSARVSTGAQRLVAAGALRLPGSPGASPGGSPGAGTANVPHGGAPACLAGVCPRAVRRPATPGERWCDGDSTMASRLLVLLASVSLGLLLEGCSLRNVKHDDCGSDDQCALTFGPGSTCTEGFCTPAATCTTGQDCRKAAGGGACV